VEIARVNEAYWKAVHAEVGISGYLGKVVAQASDVFLAAVRQYTTRPVGLSLTDANGKAVFAFGLVRETGIARVEVISGAEQAEVLAALGLALASMQGNAWRAVLVDNADRLDGLNLPRFMEAMTAAVENGWLDQAIVCGVNAPPVVKGWKITGLAAQG
jgi:hypothetical protein